MSCNEFHYTGIISPSVFLSWDILHAAYRQLADYNSTLEVGEPPQPKRRYELPGVLVKEGFLI